MELTQLLSCLPDGMVTLSIGCSLMGVMTFVGMWDLYTDAMQRDDDEAKRLKETR